MPSPRKKSPLDADLQMVKAVSDWLAANGLPTVDAESATANFKRYLSGEATLIYDPDPDCSRPCLVSERALRIIEQAGRAGSNRIDPDTIYDLCAAAGTVKAARALNYAVVSANGDEALDDDIPF